jgi:thiamine-phosphate pyrophosphorylase
VDPAARIIDANANRAGEALRTLEDLARFALDDGALAAGLKDVRHRLRTALAPLPPGWLAANRDTAGDVGTWIEGGSEYDRRSLADVAEAAGHRLAEALRSLEECAKTVDPAVGRAIERLRYETYDRAATIARRMPGPGPRTRSQWTVCVLLTESLCRLPWREVAQRSLDGGADAIQLREPERSNEGALLVERAAELVAMARPFGAAIVVNDRADVALAAGADGVHLGQRDLSPQAVRSFAGRRLVVGMSTHNADEARRALDAGVDYCGVGAMFPTDVKPGAERRGPRWFAEYLASFGAMPHLAIGGIDPANVAELALLGCRGVAVSSCVCRADAPERIVASLRTVLRGTA